MRPSIIIVVALPVLALIITIATWGHRLNSGEEPAPVVAVLPILTTVQSGQKVRVRWFSENAADCEFQELKTNGDKTVFAQLPTN